MRYPLLFLSFLVLLPSCSQEVVGLDEIENAEIVNSVSGVAIVKFEEDFLSEIEDDLMTNNRLTKSSGFNDIKQSLGIVSLKRMFPYSEKFEKRTRAEGLHRWYVVTYDSCNSFTKVSDRFAGFKGVEIVEPQRPVIKNDSFNDPWLVKQWHYFNEGNLSSSHNYGADIDVFPVWERYTTGRPDVVVAVIDGGIDQDHEDLAANCIGGYNFIDDTPTLTPEDHGTHVAGTIGAINNNGIGVCGIAGGDYAKDQKGIRLLSCQIFHNTDGMDGAPAIKWAADNGAVIAQNSWGYSFTSYIEAKNASISQYLKEAIDYFIKYAGVDENGEQTGPMKGGVVFFSAGNDGWDINPIGQYSPVISVGAIGPDGKKTSYSNYGDWVDISAPGGDSNTRNGQIISTLAHNQYGGNAGTSMACPHVSGVAALLVSYYGGKGFTATDLKERLLGGANYSFPDVYKIGPVVDALGSMTYGNGIAPDPVTDLNVELSNGKLRYIWSVTADEDDIKAYGYRLYVANTIHNLQDGIPSGAEYIDILTNDLDLGEKVCVDYSKIQFGKTYYASVAAFDRGGNMSSMSGIVSAKIPENRPPVIKPLQEIPRKLIVGAHDSMDFLFEIKDPDNHKINVSLRNAVSASGLTKKSEDIYSMTIVGNSNLQGDYQAEIIVSDEFGATSVYKLNYELLPNLSPVLRNGIEDTILTSMENTISFILGDCFVDPDGGELKYKFIFSDSSIMFVSQNNDEVLLTPINYGTTDVIVTASDSYGASSEMRFKVAVRNGTEVLAYPNPVSDYLNISVPRIGEGIIRIVSQSGITELERTYQLTPFNITKIDMRNFPTGIYYLSVTGEAGNIEKQLMKR